LMLIFLMSIANLFYVVMFFLFLVTASGMKKLPFAGIITIYRQPVILDRTNHCTKCQS